jgi:hypothetical protein
MFMRTITRGMVANLYSPEMPDGRGWFCYDHRIFRGSLRHWTAAQAFYLYGTRYGTFLLQLSVRRRMLVNVTTMSPPFFRTTRTYAAHFLFRPSCTHLLTLQHTPCVDGTGLDADAPHCDDQTGHHLRTLLL